MGRLHYSTAIYTSVIWRPGEVCNLKALLHEHLNCNGPIAALCRKVHSIGIAPPPQRRLRTFRVVRQGEQADAGGPGPGSEHRDPVGVSAKGRDVLLHPAESLDLVQQAVVPFGCLVTCAEETCSRREVPLGNSGERRGGRRKKKAPSGKPGQQC